MQPLLPRVPGDRGVLRLALPAVALLLAALGCSSRPPAVVPAATPPPEVAPPSQARVLLTLLGDQRRFDAAALGMFLSAPPAVREELAVAVGRIGDARGRGILQGLLLDSEVAVRRAAAFALGELGDPAARQALLRATVDDDPEVGALAVEALGKLATPLAEVRRPLGALDPASAARRLAPFLFRFKEEGTPAVAAELLAGAEDRDVRFGAAYALGREPRPEGAEILRGLLADPDPRIRAWSARGLGEVGTAEDLVGLGQRLADGSASMRIQALRAGSRLVSRLGALPPLGWVEPLSIQLADPAPGVRATAIEASAPWLRHPEVRGPVRARFESGSPREQELALLALARGRDPEANALVQRAAAAGERNLRARAAEAAGRLGAFELVESLANDPEAAVRVAAIEAWAGLAETTGATVPERFLDDPDPTVRATVLDALAATPELPVERLARAFERAQEDTLDDARLAAVRAVAARGGSDAAERGAAVEWLEARLESAGYLVRREAAQALVELGGERLAVGPLENGRTAAYYELALRQAERPRFAEVETDRGTLRLRLECPQAPLTCLSFLQLAGQGFFDGLTFHRVVPDFVVQGGDPRGDGWGGPGYALRDEINRLRYDRGTVGMALSGPDTGGSQFFVTLAPQPHLDGVYTAFGRVVGDDSVLDRIEAGDRLRRVREVPEGE